MTYSIILPTYREKDNIIPLIARLIDVCAREGVSAEIIVVDDNSSDGTDTAIAESFGHLGNAVRCYVRTHERGLASAIAYGINRANGEYFLVMDSDFNHDPERVPELIRHCAEHDLVAGSRFIDGGGMDNAAGRFWGSYAFNAIIRTALGMRTRDNLSGFFVIRKSILERIRHDSLFTGYGEYFIRILYYAHRLSLRIKEIPVVYLKRNSGTSNTRFVRYSMTILKTIFVLRASKAPFLKQVFVETEAYQTMAMLSEMLSSVCI
ncbi:MAG TPA: glycosyltransferase [Spirochaetota bacterium]|nr:glycosyltransferase [Spirochaetota bacterium]HNT11492.1 glycosyltransferase [Spirochaetota bacterium]